MNEMVERIARAIEAESNYVISQHHAKALARAAIAAMREPTDAMLDVACEQTLEPEIYRIDAVEQWQGMIDEALKD